MSDRRNGLKTQVDVLVITALQEEFDAVLRVEEGALPGSTWVVRPGPTTLDVAFRSFQAAGGGVLHVAVARAVMMGGVATASAAAALVQHYRPLCLAMCGVCAGRKGAVEQGDVIIANRLWDYDVGKLTAEIDESGKRVEHFEGEALSYLLRDTWLQKAETFIPPRERAWLSECPRPYVAQMDWMLERILKGEDPVAHPERKVKCANYPEVLRLLWQRGWLQDEKLLLTDTGQRRIQKLLLLHPDGLPEPKPFRVHVGPLGTGSKVVRDPLIFTRLAERERKLLGLEMEASAIGATAHQHSVPYMIVMKGVTDFADSDKDDHFKPFAARASAECLLAFVRAHLLSDPALGSQRGASRASEADFQDVIELGAFKPPANPSPSALLDARYRFMPFFEQGRAALLQDLRAWCEEQEPVSVRLFHGAGGMGKTRLFIEWIERLRQEGWWAGFLQKSVDPARFEELLDSAGRLLVVIDYAESRQSLGALLQLVARRRNSGHPGCVRLVLLARTANDWWQELMASEGQVKDLLRDKPATEVAPLVVGGAERKEVFERAVRRFAELRGHSATSGVVPALEDPRFERVLYVHMAALAVVDGLSFSAESLMEEILDHEERFWLTQAQPKLQTDGERRLFKDRMRRVVTALTLRGGASGQVEAEALLSRMSGAQDGSLLLFLRDLYAGGGESARQVYVGGLEPDLLGEAMVLRTLRKQDDAARGFLEGVFEGANEHSIRTGFEVLGRLSAEHSDEAGRWIGYLLEQGIEKRAVPAVEAAKAVGLRTAYATLGPQLAGVLERSGTPEVAAQLEAVGLPYDARSLHAVVHWVLTTQLRHLPDGNGMEVVAARARLLNDLSLIQGALEKRWEALASIDEAVAHYRKLARAFPPMFLPDLAMALSNLGTNLSEVGHKREALETLEKAVEIRRELAQEAPEVFLSDLAGSLISMVALQREVGWWDAALESAEEAVTLFRQLAAVNPGMFLSNLAESLNSLGNIQGETGKKKASLKSLNEAVAIRRGLAQAHPDVFLSDLAAGLLNLGVSQSAVGLHQEALVSVEEAVAIFRKLVQVHPTAFLPKLAGCLNNLGGSRGELKMYEEALPPTQEAVALFRDLARKFPDAFQSELARCLGNLGRRQIELERREEALASVQESVALYRTLAKELPDAFLPELAGALDTLAYVQLRAGKLEGTLASAQEAAEVLRELEWEDPERYLPDLAATLMDVSKLQKKLGMIEPSVVSAREAVEHYRKLAKEFSEEFVPDLAVSLCNLGLMQSTGGRTTEALVSMQESIEVLWPLFLEHTRMFREDAGFILEEMSALLKATGQTPSQEFLERVKVFGERSRS
ncbi:tetratricopeptide repeat protein [Archangium lansingense]|uniref:phosphorylase family protein n=1 Tax=Archangium lansingense TaxID=2995310 RepID=UPI003B775602